MFTVRDAKLAEFRVTWDNMTVLGQLGLLPDQAPPMGRDTMASSPWPVTSPETSMRAR